MSDSAQIAGATTREELTALLAPWLPAQRWFVSKGTAADDVAIVGALTLSDEDDDPGVEVLVLLVSTAGITYQVPLTVHWAPDLELSRALVGVLPGEDGPRWVYDGPHDPAFVRAYLTLLATPTPSPTPSSSAVIMHAENIPWQVPGFSAAGHRPADGLPVDPWAPSSVLRGEQSNTSVIVGADGPNPLIVKLFRVLAPGDNPDVVIQSALAAAGSTRVPRPAGWIRATWTSRARGAAEAAGAHGVAEAADADPRADGDRDPDGVVSGHLAFACEFLPGSEDAWRVAVRAVADGTSFAQPARELGAATAQVHAVLADVMPRSAATPELLGALADALVDRVDWAVAAAPVLQPFAAAARSAVDAVRGVAQAPDLQQVHGDYHLGQVLHSDARGWVLLDFEGEPLRPLSERMRPDLALRDVAGMLRSFDYAARHALISSPTAEQSAGQSSEQSAGQSSEQSTGQSGQSSDADRWVDEARDAFLVGYASVGGRDPREDDVLLRALELDKALYEVVYEVGNRPTWVEIPMSAVRRLLPQIPG